MATQKHTVSPEAKDTDKRSLKPLSSTLSAVPSTLTANNSTVPDLTGVSTPLDTNILLDLVVNCKASNPDPDTADPVSTEEELDAIDAIVKLG